MAHVAKYTRAASGHMFKHYERAKDKTGEYIKFGNQEIDLTRTHENYNLAPHRASQGEFIRQRCGEVKMQNRKDVNVMCSWAVTAPKDLPAAGREQFFKTAYDFLSARYGGEKNVVSAYVHMDETTPHMHFAFVPVVHDSKKGIDKVSAKEAIDRRDLKTFHQDLSICMERTFGQDIGILNEATKDGNKTVDELKRNNLKREIAELEKKVQDAQQDATEAHQEAVAHRGVVEALQKEKNAIRGQILDLTTEREDLYRQKDEVKASLIPIGAEYEARKAFIDNCVKHSDVSVLYPSWVTVNRNVFGKETGTVTVPKKRWEEKHISANQIEALRAGRAALEKGIDDFRWTASVQRLSQELKKKKEENQALAEENDTLKRDLRAGGGREKQMQRILQSNPHLDDLYKRTAAQIQAEEEQQREQSRQRYRNRGMER